MSSMNAQILHYPEATPDGPFAGFDVAMAFCRLTSELASQDRASKSGKEVWCLSQLLTPTLERLFGSPGVNLIDLGTGNGEKALQIVHAIQDMYRRPVHYYPVDRSVHISLYAILTILLAQGGIGEDEAAALSGSEPSPGTLDALSARPFPYETVISEMCRGEPTCPTLYQANLIMPTRGLEMDFMGNPAGLTGALSQLAMYRDGRNIFCLLGQTLGNYATAKRGALLRALAHQMEQDDLLLIDGGVRPEEATTRWDSLDRRIANLVEFYRCGERFMRYEADCDDSSYQVTYDSSLHEVTYWFERPDGSRQDLGFTCLWSVRDFQDELQAAGLEVLRTTSSLDLPDVRSGPECVAVLARKATKS